MHVLLTWPSYLTAAALVLGLGGNLWADDPVPGAKPAKAQDLDGTLYRGLKGAINQGVDLYKAGDHYGCYRLFQGIVISLKPVLADRPELQRTLDAGLADAESRAEAWQRAWALRKALDEVRAELKKSSMRAGGEIPERGAAAQMPKKASSLVEGALNANPPAKKTTGSSKDKTSLWERLGGQTKVAKIVEDFTELAASDPKVNFTRNGKIKLKEADVLHFKQSMIDFVSQVTGGPLRYEGKTMKEVHKGMAITNAEFDAVAADLKKALQMNEVKKADIDAVLDLVETTRKEIVEVPGAGKAPAGKEGVRKKSADKDGDEKPPF